MTLYMYVIFILGKHLQVHNHSEAETAVGYTYSNTCLFHTCIRASMYINCPIVFLCQYPVKVRPLPIPLRQRRAARLLGTLVGRSVRSQKQGWYYKRLGACCCDDHYLLRLPVRDDLYPFI